MGAASLSRNDAYAKPRTYAKLWGVVSATSGSIAAIAILVNFIYCNIFLGLIVYFAGPQVRCALSPDTGFTSGPSTNRSGIDYQKDFHAYKEYINSKAGTSYHKALFQFYNSIIFGTTELPSTGNNDDDDSSGLEYAFDQMALLSNAADEPFGNAKTGSPHAQGSPKTAVAGPSRGRANATRAARNPLHTEPVVETALVPNDANEVPGTEGTVQLPARRGRGRRAKGKA